MRFRRPALSGFTGAVVIAMAIGCGSSPPACYESKLLPEAPTGESDTEEPGNPVSESELRAVLFDNAILGYQARHPLIIAKAGMRPPTSDHGSNAQTNNAETIQNLRIIEAASQKAAALDIHEQVWQRIYEEIPKDTLIAAYAFTRNDAFQRCAKVGISQLQLLDNMPENFSERIHQPKAEPAQLTDTQEASIALYLEREAPFLRQMDREMAYWTALGTAIILNEMLTNPTVTITDPKRARVQASLSQLKSSLIDEAQFLKDCTSAVSLSAHQKELAAIFSECAPGDAKVYWQFLSSPQFQEYHHATWRIFYEITTTSMKSLLDL